MTALSTQEFLDRFQSVNKSFQALTDLRRDAIATENIFRELFARQRESWVIPEIDDPFVFLVKVFSFKDSFVKVPDFEEDTIPRCLSLDSHKKLAAGSPVTVKSLEDFIVSWECFTEGLLRFVEWENILAAGGSVAGCLAPLPSKIATANNSSTRVQRRKYFHDNFLPGSDIDLFLYGLNETEAEAKLLEIYDAVQAASPYEIRAFRSAHAISLVSVYPYRHVQIVLRLYNSPSEILMGFDVDACAAGKFLCPISEHHNHTASISLSPGFDGSDVFVCPRTALAMITQSNTVDMTRRSPSYEMRLSKYAERGFEVLVQGLDRDRVDPFLYEKRFDQIKGLARLLMLERLRTPEDRMRYRLQSQFKKSNEWQIQNKIRKLAGDVRNIERMEGNDGIVPNVSGPEASDYSAVFLPWGPNWPVSKLERMTKKKDEILNKVEFLPNGQVIGSRRPYKLHVCAIGTMAEVIEDPFPNDAPIPDDVSPEALDGAVRGRITWLVDNPGRQRIGSFHPITEEDWNEGAFISKETEDLILATVANDCTQMKNILESEKVLASRDFLGRTALHVSVVAGSKDACRMLLAHPEADSDFLKARLADGRNALHLSAIKGDLECVKLILAKVKTLVDQNNDEIPREDIFDIDGSDWEVKLNPLHYAILFGHLEIVVTLLAYGADASKAAVHKDRNESLSSFSLLSIYCIESGKEIDLEKVEEIARLLLHRGATASQIDTVGSTCWHRLASCLKPSSNQTLELLLKIHREIHGGTPNGLNIINDNHQTPLYLATQNGNSDAVRTLLKAGALPFFDVDVWDALVLKKQAPGPSQRRYYTPVSSLGACAMRSPVFLSALYADVDTLSVFLNQCPEIVASELCLPYYVAQKVLPSAWIPNLARDEEIRVGLKDVVAANLWQLEDGSKVDVAMSSKKKTLQAMKEHETKIEQELENASGAYKRRFLLLVRVQLTQRRQTALTRSNLDASSNDEKKSELDSALKRLKECDHLLTSNGALAKVEQRTDVGLRSSTNDPQPKALNAKSNWFRHVGVAQFNAFLQECRGSTSYRYVSFRTTPESKRVRFENFFEAIFENKPLSIIRHVSRGLEISVYDSTGSTAISLAVKNGALDTFLFLIGVAKEQHATYLETQRQLRQAENEVRTGKLQQSENPLKDQLRRINNTDIVSGSKLGNSVPTPDLMRERLQRAEASALLQASALLDPDEATVSTDVPVDRLLLFRSIFLVEDDPCFISLKQKLATTNPGLFPADYVAHPVRLRPIEVAMIRNDLQMLALIQQQLFQAARIPSPETSAIGKQTNVVSDNEVYYGRDSDGECDSDTSEIENAQNGSFTVEELRYLVYGEGSRNPDLGGMTLIQLAVLLDETSVLTGLAPFAREQMIPRFSVAAWKAEFANKEELDPEGQIKKDPISEREDICKGPLWMTDQRKSNRTYRQFDIPIHPTILQVALSFQSSSLIEGILFGNLGERIFSWINTVEVPDRRIGKRSYPYTVLDGPLAALNWLIQLLKASSDVRMEHISHRLCGVGAVDAAGRSAFFYGEAHLIPELVKLCDIQEKSCLIEKTMTGGLVTPLIASACSGSFKRVKALLESGADISQAYGDRAWNVIHFVIDSTEYLGRSGEADEWNSARKMIEFLQANSDPKAIAAALLCPKTEHTPLMIAANKSAPSDFLAFLLAMYGPHASEGLKRRDFELNSLLHVVVRSSLRQQKDKGVSLLLNCQDKPELIGPSVENSNGITPSEIALQEISSPWVRGAASKRSVQPRHTEVRFANRSIPEDLSKRKVDSEITFERQLLIDLHKSRQSRLPSCFQAVKQAKNLATKGKGKQGVSCSPSPEEFVRTPHGIPSVLIPYQPMRMTRMNDAKAPTEWQGWYEQY